MEECHYIFHNDIDKVNKLECQRVYLGHETCEKRIPSFNELKPLLMLLKERGINLTLLIPFLTEEGLRITKNLIEKLRKEITDLEVASSDWGLLYWLSINKIAKPVVGRFLLGQKTDPRYGQISLNYDLKLHLSSCALLKKDILAYFNQLGIYRFEISDSSFQHHLPCDEVNRFSLHIPYVPIAVMRWCISKNMDFNFLDKNCSALFCKGSFQQWDTIVDGYKFLRVDNALFYILNREIDYNAHSSIDRIVINHRY
jgi:hypothetical protein